MRFPGSLAMLAALLGANPALQGQVLSVTGTVMDAGGAPVASAEVKLVCDAIPARSATTTTDGKGTYRFTASQPCDYRLMAARNGLGSASLAVHLEDATPLVRNLVLPEIKAATGVPRPKFAASGIRGVIDPGGYSAPAGAAAASGMLAGMAGLKRNETVSSPNCVSASAIARLQDVHQRMPDDVAVMLDLAAALLAQQSFGPALRVLRSASTPPENPRFHHLLARAEEGTGDFLSAAEQYRLLTELEPSDTMVFNSGFELVLAGKLGEAATIFQDGLVRFPHSAALLIGTGTTAFLQGKTDAAVSSFLSAAEQDAVDPRPYPFLAAASTVQSSQVGPIRAAFDRHVAANPADAAGLTAYASVLGRDARNADPETNRSAEQLLLHAIQLEPSLAKAHYELGVLYSHTAGNREAITELRRAAELEPEHTEAHYHLSQSLRKDGQTDEAEREMQIFTRLKTGQAENGPDLRQYLSVMAKPSDPASACAQSSR